VSSRDRDFRSTRRRDFDDDNFETPRRSFGSTPGSSAQRFEAPPGPPVQAVVKWYNADKGFGFVQLADGSGDAFLHVSVVERSRHNSIPPGATLEIRAGPGPKRPQVSEILSVDSSTAQQEPPRRARPERPMYPPADRAAVEESGTVKWYNAMKGFGFIASDRGGNFAAPRAPWPCRCTTARRSGSPNTRWRGWRLLPRRISFLRPADAFSLRR
jgi:cold shock protein